MANSRSQLGSLTIIVPVALLAALSSCTAPQARGASTPERPAGDGRATAAAGSMEDRPEQRTVVLPADGSGGQVAARLDPTCTRFADRVTCDRGKLCKRLASYRNDLHEPRPTGREILDQHVLELETCRSSDPVTRAELQRILVSLRDSLYDETSRTQNDAIACCHGAPDRAACASEADTDSGFARRVEACEAAHAKTVGHTAGPDPHGGNAP